MNLEESKPLNALSLDCYSVSVLEDDMVRHKNGKSASLNRHCSSSQLTRCVHTTNHEAVLVLAALCLIWGERWIDSAYASLRETEAQFCAFFGELIPDVAGTIG